MSAKRFLLTHLKWLLPLVLLVLAVVVFRTLMATRPQAPAQQVSERVWSVHAVAAAPQRLRPQIELYGAIETPQMATLSAVVEADVIAVAAREGAEVASGELLVQLDSRELALDIRQQQAQLDSIAAQIEAERVRHRSDLADLTLQQELVALKEKDLTRYRNLAERNMVSQQQIDSARTALQQQRLNLSSLQEAIADHPNRLAQLNAERARLEALLDQLRLDLERTEIRAPYPARIAATHVARGDRVRSGDALIDLYDLERLEVRAQVPEQLLRQLRPAMHNRASPVIAHAHLDGEPLQLQLDRLGATVSSGRAGLDALFRLIEPPLVPEPGRSLRLSVELPAQDDLIPLPATALYGTDRVYRIDAQSRLEPIPVERVGQRLGDDGETQILVRSEALQAGDRIITTQLPNAIAGLLVEVAE